MDINIKVFSDVILLGDRKDVLRVHLYTKLIQHKIRPFEKDIDIILELYLFGGYNNAEEQEKFIEICLGKKYRKSDQSFRNALSKYTKLGVFKKKKNSTLYVDEKFLSSVECDKLVLTHKISHAN